MNIENLFKSPQQRRQAINYDTLRKFVGWLGISLPLLLIILQPLSHKMHRGDFINADNPVQYHYRDMKVNWYCVDASQKDSVCREVTACSLHSGYHCEETRIDDYLRTISNYHQFYMRDIFVGVLLILAAILITYQGESVKENILSSLAGICAVIVALAPCYDKDYFIYHYIAAVGLFFIFMLFCFIIFPDSTPDKSEDVLLPLHRLQRRTYRICGTIILFCLLTCGLLKYFKHEGNLVFWFESLMLWAFGISWLASGKFQMARIRLYLREENIQHAQQLREKNTSL